MANKNYTFVLNFGYAESGSMAFLPFTSRDKFSNAREALVNLSQYLKSAYSKDNEEVLIDSCKKAAECCVSDEIKYCAKCGRLVTKSEFDVDDFMSWLYGMQTDCDTFHADYIHDNDDQSEWQSNGLEGTKNQRFVYTAEKVIASALGYEVGNHTFEDVCAARTKAKVECFSYW